MNGTGEWLALAISAAEAAGELLRSGRGPGGALLEGRAATGRDTKLAADTAAEALILDRLAPSGLPVLAEESGAHGALNGRHWVVDPLDGTANYARGLPGCAVAIALVDGEAPLFGVIHDLDTGGTYSGGEGVPAVLDGAPLRVSAQSDPGRSVLMTGLPVHGDYGDAALGAMARDFQSWKKVRMIGTAAMAGAHVAAGRADRYAESGARLWDVAAAAAIVRAAGGRALLSTGAPDAPRRILIDNGALPLPEAWQRQGLTA